MLCCLPLERKQRSIPILSYLYSLCHIAVSWWIALLVAFSSFCPHTQVKWLITKAVLLRVPVSLLVTTGTNSVFLVLHLTFWAEAFFSWVPMHCIAKGGWWVLGNSANIDPHYCSFLFCSAGCAPFSQGYWTSHLAGRAPSQCLALVLLNWWSGMISGPFVLPRREM